MEQVLAELNKTPDVVGSCIVADDGIVVASDFSSNLDDEMLGALMSSIIRTANQATRKMDYGAIRNYMLEAEKNKLFFNKCKFGFIVAITTAGANLGLLRVEMKNAVKKVENISL